MAKNINSKMSHALDSDSSMDCNKDSCESSSGSSSPLQLPPQVENTNYTRTQFEKLKVAEIICCVLGVTGIACGVMLYDLSYAPSTAEQVQEQTAVLLALSSLITALLLVSVVWRSLKSLR